MTVLVEFIGGPWDGQRRALEEAPWQLRVVVPPVVWVGPVGVVAPEPLSVPRELTYRRVPRRGAPAEAPLRYVLESLLESPR